MTITLLEFLGWLLIAGLWWMFYGPVRTYHCDRARYQLSVIRDDLFEIALQGTRFKFEDQAYGLARTNLNGMLRTVEDFSVVRLLTLIWRNSRNKHWRSMCADYERNFERAINELPPEGRQLIHDAMGNAHHAMFTCLLRRSLILLMLLAAGRLLRPIGSSITRIRSSKQIKIAMSCESNIFGRDEIGYGLAT